MTLNSLNSIADSKLSQSVELLPNPVTDKLEIHTELIPESIIIYTSDGRIISVHENTNLRITSYNVCYTKLLRRDYINSEGV